MSTPFQPNCNIHTCNRRVEQGQDICDPTLIGKSVDCDGTWSPGKCGTTSDHKPLCPTQTGSGFTCQPCVSPVEPPFRHCAFQPFGLHVQDNSYTLANDNFDPTDFPITRKIIVADCSGNIIAATSRVSQAYDTDRNNYGPYELDVDAQKILQKPLYVRISVKGQNWQNEKFVEILMPYYKDFYARGQYGTESYHLEEQKSVRVCLEGDNPARCSKIITKWTHDPTKMLLTPTQDITLVCEDSG